MAKAKKQVEGAAAQGATPAPQPLAEGAREMTSAPRSRQFTADFTGGGKRYASEVQRRVFERREAAEKAKTERFDAIRKKAMDASASFKVTFIPYKDRDGQIVPALVLGVEERLKKDKGGPVLDENNEQVSEAVLKLMVFSNIDEPRKVLYTFEEEKP